MEEKREVESGQKGWGDGETQSTSQVGLVPSSECKLRYKYRYRLMKLGPSRISFSFGGCRPTFEANHSSRGTSGGQQFSGRNGGHRP